MSIFPAGYVTVEAKQEQKSKPSIKGKNPNYFTARDLVFKEKEKDSPAIQEEATFIMCGFFSSGHFIGGKCYWTQEPRIQKKFPFDKGVPANYKKEISLKWGSKAVYGEHDEKEDLDYVRDFVSFVAYFPYSKKDAKKQINKLEKYPELDTEGSFKIVTFDRSDLKGKLENIIKMSDDYFQLPNGLWNFKMVLKRLSKQDADLTPALMPKIPPTIAKAWEENKDKIWLPALFEQGDPFLGKPADETPPGLPPTNRDDYGADHELDGQSNSSSDDIPGDWG